MSTTRNTAKNTLNFAVKIFLKSLEQFPNFATLLEQIFSPVFGMKTLISSLALGTVLTGTLFAGELKPQNATSVPAAEVSNVAAKAFVPLGWTDDLDAAKKQAAEEGKLLLVNFSGSDWCGWCIRLDNEVFSKKEFLDGAKDKFVLVFIDSPRDKNRLSEKGRARNKKLVDEYGVRGFPTVMILDEAGKPIAQTGYVRGGAKKYLQHLDELLEEQKTMMALEKEIRDLEVGSEARAKKIHEVMKEMCAEEQLKHREMINEVLAFDADGSAGMREHYPLFTLYLPLADCVRQVSMAICTDAREAYEKTTPEERKNPDMGRKVFIDAAREHADELRNCLKKIEETERQIPQGELVEWVRQLKRQITMQLDAIRPAPKKATLPVVEEEEEDLAGIFED